MMSQARPKAALSSTPGAYGLSVGVSGPGFSEPGPLVRRPIFIRRMHRWAGRRGPVGMPAGYVAGLEAAGREDRELQLRVCKVVSCGERSVVYQCLWDPDERLFSPCRCGDSALCPTCARRDTDRSANLFADDVRRAVLAVRRRREISTYERDHLDNVLGLIGMVVTLRPELRRFVSPGKDATARLARVGQRVVREVFGNGGTREVGALIGIEWFGERTAGDHLHPQINVRLVNIARRADPRGSATWETFARRLESCIAHNRWGKALNDRTCSSSTLCVFHTVEEAAGRAFEAEFSPVIPTPIDGAVREWIPIVHVGYDPLEEQRGRHDYALLDGWDEVVRARASYDVKPSAEVVSKWAELRENDGIPSMVPVEVVRLLAAMKGSAGDRATRRIRRIGWLAASVRRRRLAELAEIPAAVIPILSAQDKVAPSCPVHHAGVSPARKEYDQGPGLPLGYSEWTEATLIAEARGWSRVVWIRQDSLAARPETPVSAVVIDREPMRPDPGGPPDRGKEFFWVGSRAFSTRVRVDQSKLPVTETAPPWICVRCRASLPVISSPVGCYTSLGGCGRPAAETMFIRKPSIPELVPFREYFAEVDRLYSSTDSEIRDRHFAECGADSSERAGDAAKIWAGRTCPICRYESMHRPLPEGI